MVDSIREAAGHVLVAGFTGTSLPAEVHGGLARHELGGVILFRRNIESVAQAHALNREAIEAAVDPPLIAVDQEGGRVARLGAPVLKLPAMRALGTHDDHHLTRRLAGVLGAQLRMLGFSMNFAPVLDIDTNPDNPVIGDRAFGDTPDRVIKHGLSFALGLHDGGVLSCGKHFPGHGDTDLDSHLALPTLRHARERLDRVELAPFVAALSTLPSLMTAHVLFEALDPNVPATLSPRVITGLLREELGYEGVIISDDLEMKAVSEKYGIVRSAIMAIDAGCDLLLICSRLDACFEAYDALVTHAEKDPAFAQKLRLAADRTLAMRRRVAPTSTALDLSRIAKMSEQAQVDLEQLA